MRLLAKRVPLFSRDLPLVGNVVQRVQHSLVFSGFYDVLGHSGGRRGAVEFLEGGGGEGSGLDGDVGT